MLKKWAFLDEKICFLTKDGYLIERKIIPELREMDEKSTANKKQENSQMSEVAEKVKKIVVDQLGVSEDQVTDDARFMEDLGADSLDTVELVMALEEEFGSDIPDEDAEKLKTVGAVIEYIKSKSQD